MSDLVDAGSGFRVGSAANQRPASGGVARTGMTAAAFSAAALGVDQGTEVLETVGGDQAGGHEFPEGIFDFAGEAAGSPGEVVEERGAVAVQGFDGFTGGMRQRVTGRDVRLDVQDPAGVFAEEERDGCDPSGGGRGARDRTRRGAVRRGPT